MKFKMLCLDMDGTLLNNRKEISEENKTAIAKLKDMGIRVVVCTGRLFVSAKYFADLIGERVDVIASNGAYIIDEKGEVIFHSKLGVKNSIASLDVMRKNGVAPHFYSIDTLYTEKMAHSSLFYKNYNDRILEEKYKVKFQMVEDWEKIIKENSDVIMKAVGVHENDEVILKARSEMKANRDVSVVYSHESNFEVMDKGVSKGSSIAVLAAHYGIKREEIVAFGDSNNDVSMLEYAGMGVAMGNGTDEVKQKAEFITDDNDKSGVAKGVKKIFFDEIWK